MSKVRQTTKYIGMNKKQTKNYDYDEKMSSTLIAAHY